MRFDLTDLRLFLHIHDTGTITAGAQRAHMTAASASERIRGMEHMLGVPLLTRGRRGTTATDAGRTLVHHARAVLGQMDRLHSELGQYGRGMAGHVRLLCNTVALSEYLPDALAPFLLAHPRVSIDLEERLSQDIVHAVRTGHCDLGVVSDASDLEGLQTALFREDPLAVIVPRAHALAQRQTVCLADLVGHDVVGLVEDSALQTHIDLHARRLGAHLHYRVRLSTFDGIWRMVGHGIGIAVVPHAAARRAVRARTVARLRLTDTWARRRLMLCLRDLPTLPPYARAVFEHLRQTPLA